MPASKRSFLLPAVAVITAFAILVGLGTWQLSRRAWKLDLISRIEARANAPAAPVPPPADWPKLERARDEYRHVSARGTFDHAKEVLVYTVGGDGLGPYQGAPGFLVITPLMRADGPPVLVNRGFVPVDRRAPGTRAQGQVPGEVEVTGALRFTEEASMFVPANDPAHDAFYRRDPAEIAAARGLAGAAPFIIDLDAGAAPGGLPVSAGTRVDLPNRHLEYALTWYGLALTLLGVVLAVVLSRRRKARDA